MPITIPPYDELLDALLSMAEQYLYDSKKEMFTHDFMCAGEHCLDVLERVGLLKQVNAAYYKYKETEDEKMDIENDYGIDDPVTARSIRG